MKQDMKIKIVTTDKIRVSFEEKSELFNLSTTWVLEHEASDDIMLSMDLTGDDDTVIMIFPDGRELEDGMVAKEKARDIWRILIEEYGFDYADETDKRLEVLPEPEDDENLLDEEFDEIRSEV
jgi:hypothetical protein